MGSFGSPWLSVAGEPVFSTRDWPAPVAGVITLPGNTAYQLMGSIRVPDGQRVVVPADTSIVGLVPSETQLLGNVNAALLTIVAPVSGSSGHLDRIRVENLSTGASAQAIDFTSAAGVTTLADSLIKASVNALRVTSAGSVKVIGCTLASTANGSETVLVSSAAAMVFEYCQTTAGLAGKHFSSTAGATAGNFSFLRHGIIFGDAAQVAFYADPTMTVTGKVIFERILTFGAAGTLNVNWDQSTPRFRTLAVQGLPDSSAIGGSYIATPSFLVPIITQNVWTPIAPAVGTPWGIEAHAERFSLVSGSTGQVRYTGVDPLRFMFVGSVSLSKTGTTVGSRLGLFVNGVLHPGSDTLADVTTRSANRSIAPVIGVLNQNDVIDLRVLNVDNVDDFNVDAGSFACIAANIS